MDYKLKISRKDFEESIKNRIDIGKILFDKLRVVKSVDNFNDLKLDYELWDDFNINFIKASFTKEQNDELYTYNDGIAYIELKSALNNYDSNPNLKLNEILTRLNKQISNLKILQNRIEFYQEISETEIKDSIEDIELFSLEIIKNTRGYIENTGKQIIICYKYSLYDACLVLIRRLLETLIIECFEKFKIQSKIQDSSGNYFYMSDLITKFLEDNTWTVTRNTKQALPKIKMLADLSAHNRRFNAKKPDIDQIKIDLRVSIEELIHIIDY